MLYFTLYYLVLQSESLDLNRESETRNTIKWKDLAYVQPPDNSFEEQWFLMQNNFSGL